VLAIALLTIGTSLIGDGIARASAGIERGGGEEWARESTELSKERERE
jgi:hypothetical protein